ncbi:flavin reductase family protein [Mariniluteicoccus flavus]
MRTLVISPSVHYFGSAVVIVSTSNADGSTNLTPISSTWSLEDRYVLGMLRVHRGAENLERNGQAVLNLVGAHQCAAVEAIAPTTGSPEVPEPKRGVYRHEPDKWSLGGFTPEPSDLVAPARVAECPVQLEAELVDTMPMSALMMAYQLRVRRVHAHADASTRGARSADASTRGARSADASTRGARSADRQWAFDTVDMWKSGTRMAGIAVSVK